MEFIETMKSSNLVWLVLSLCSIISVPLAIYFGRKSLSQKIINAVLYSNELITNKQSYISKLKILYDDEVVDDVTVTWLTFWNKTLTTINKTDIIDAEPLSIFTNDGKILDISVVIGSESPNRINVFLTSDNNANITFDYLDKKEGGIINVIHTGSPDSIDITRKIKGGKVKVQKSLSQTNITRYIPFLILGLISPYLIFFISNLVVEVILIIMQIGFMSLATVFSIKNLSASYVPKNCNGKIFHKSSDSN